MIKIITTILVVLVCCLITSNGGGIVLARKPTQTPSPTPTPPPSQVILPSNANLFYQGRVDQSNSSVYSFDWSGVAIGFAFKGTTNVRALFSTSLTTEDNMFNVFINYGLYSTLNISSTSNEAYNLISGGTLDPQQTYILILTKRTEAAIGIINFYGLVVDQSAILFPINPFNDNPNKRIEFIGDSITCGYGIDGTPPCSFTAETENNYQTYAGVVSRILGADLHVESWSGKGVVRNYDANGTTSVDPFPTYYGRTIANNPNSTWTFQDWVPQAVVINLGTNDFSSQPYPPQTVFEQGYTNFIDSIRTKYNNGTVFFLACGPMISDPCCQYVQNVATATKSIYIDLQDILDSSDLGCNGHPNVNGHLKMAMNSLPIIQKNLGW
ncbi:hypothetical protein DFA_01136 [Cavenderia fasciculata]|uniref:Esterase n=1 Tax=Cavenderia fasciculata TaxID=261658 RepID=F4PQZ2_CACFS|nr:uncharacterized protein DFA_01136 [Cavenderia fasciculata]EGG21257.1 hypothetical protein DFA_01136 [Cavenderia fasciculata]|eukprot:XP_004359107.1 hypothetical protein DFA_01136 [Cavenderia fasciculata]